MTGEPTQTTSVLHINYRLKSEVAITFHCQLCSICYQPVQIKKHDSGS